MISSDLKLPLTLIKIVDKKLVDIENFLNAKEITFYLIFLKQ